MEPKGSDGDLIKNNLLTDPTLARCDNRNTLAKSNLINGAPEEWFSRENLSRFGLAPVNIDFFVNWTERPNRITRNVWIKKILTIKPEYFSKEQDVICIKKVSDAIIASEGADHVRLVYDFFSSIKVKVDYLLFRDINWEDSSVEKIILARLIIIDGQVSFQVKYIDLDNLKSRINKGSGGAFHVGKKGLIYGTSSLECFLSKTGSAYPGDADLIIVEKNTRKAVAIFEFKKHNLASPLSEQMLGNYYPRPDQKKYDRLAMLRNYINPAIPLVNLYYPTRGGAMSKLEVIEGDITSLKAGKTDYINMPVLGDKDSEIEYVESVINFINCRAGILK